MPAETMAMTAVGEWVSIAGGMMRLYLTIAAFVFVTIATGPARAQEVRTAVQGGDDAAVTPQQPRAPSMVVHEPVTLPKAAEPPKTDPKKVDAAQKKPAAGAATQPAAAVVEKAQQPIVIGGANAESQAGPIYTGTSGNQAVDDLVMQSATRHGVDPNLVFAVMRQESGFNPRAVSYKGASGLMQLMPATARRFGVTNIFDTAQNVEGGTRYLRFLLDTFGGDVRLALAGYNAGEHAVINSGFNVPRYRETQNYVRNITAKYGSTTHRGAGSARSTPQGNPAAPSAMAFAAGKLSNNY